MQTALFWGLETALSARGDGKGIHLDALDHGEQAIGACGGKMLGQPDFADEIEVGIEDFLCRMTVDHTEEEGHDALDDEGVALSTELEDAVGVLVAHNPDDEILLVLFFGRKGIARFAQIDEQLVAVHPIFNLGKFLDDFVLYFVDGHN